MLNPIYIVAVHMPIGNAAAHIYRCRKAQNLENLREEEKV